MSVQNPSRIEGNVADKAHAQYPTATDSDSSDGSDDELDLAV